MRWRPRPDTPMPDPPPPPPPKKTGKVTVEMTLSTEVAEMLGRVIGHLESLDKRLTALESKCVDEE